MGIEQSNHVGRNIRALRKKFRETQNDLAMAIDVTPAAISNYERGDRLPKYDTLLKIAKHYWVVVDVLLDDQPVSSKPMKDVPLNDNEKNIANIYKLFPILCTPKALENSNFANGHRLHTNLLQVMLGGGEPEQQEMDQCLEYYKAAGNQGVLEAVANHLGFHMLVGVSLNQANPRLVARLEMVDMKSVTLKDIISDYLPAFDEILDEDIEWKKICDEFYEDSRVDIAADTIVLKRTDKYVDLADFYIALRYLFCFESDSIPSEVSRTVGIEMLSMLALYGNPYAEEMLGQKTGE